MGVLLEDEADTLSPLPIAIRNGLSVVATVGFVSFGFVSALLTYLSWRFLKWYIKQPTQDALAPSAPGHQVVDEDNLHEMLGMSPRNFAVVVGRQSCDRTSEQSRAGFWSRIKANPPNQFLVLIYNLLLADIMQAMGYFMSAQWLSLDGIFAGHPVCWAQGWFFLTGNLASSLFITTIAVHNYLGVVKRFRPPYHIFYLVIIGLWSFVYGIALLGIIISRGSTHFYSRAGEWCWINYEYQPLRLYLHYLWIFFCLAATTLVYLAIVIHLFIHGKHNPSSCRYTTPAIKTATEDRELLGISNFLLFPLIYIICTVPLASARIASMVGSEPPLAFYSVAGSLMASAGWLDVVMYSLTRKPIVFSGKKPPMQDTGLETFGFMASSLRTPPGRIFGNVVFIEGGDGQTCRRPGIERLWGWMSGLWSSLERRRAQRLESVVSNIEIPSRPRTEREEAVLSSARASLGLTASDSPLAGPGTMRSLIKREMTAVVELSSEKGEYGGTKV
ncbi:hypothetical protein QBC36DRAFT_227364 [Triangularia setosa]|uniref:G-protein coupled receptors family 1 profile domain-containing protein n=1 Tax=Triangularia setosa TaxID=2587417 RepID=A0AAN6WGX3_9PEZI|nr:hypothetical protein QBC36DRAFT_227364 [Podospora setosa]